MGSSASSSESNPAQTHHQNKNNTSVDNNDPGELTPESTSKPGPASATKELEKEVESTKRATYSHTKQAGGVAPMIIKVGQEEYMNYNECDQTIYGSLGHQSVQHPLHEGKFVLVRSEEYPEIQAGSSHFFLGCQPLSKLEARVSELSTSSQPVNIISSQNDPILYVNADNDHIPCYLHPANPTTSPSHSTTSPSHPTTAGECEFDDLKHRKKMLAIATMTDDFTYYYYSTACSENCRPIKFKLVAEDDLLTSREVAVHLQQKFQRVEYSRIPLPAHKLPSMAVIDQLIEVLKTPQTLLVLAVSPYSSRSQFVSVLSKLLTAMTETHQFKLSRSNDTVSSLRAFNYLQSVLLDFTKYTEEIEAALNELYGESECHRLDNHAPEIDESSQQTSGRLQYHILLILVQAYWSQTRGLLMKFSQWLEAHQEIYACFKLTKFTSEPNRSIPNLLMRYHLENDQAVQTDFLGTKESLGCLNLHHIRNTPIYGLAQPSLKGVEALLKHVGVQNYAHRKTKLVSLRQDPCILINGEPYSLRSRDGQEILRGSMMSGTDLIHMEKNLLTVVANYNKSKLDKIFHSSIEPTATVNLLERLELNEDIQLIRLPIDEASTPSFTCYETIIGLVDDMLSQEDGHTVLAFLCHSGKSRTITAVSIASLAYFKNAGYPSGAAKGESDRTSVRDVQYTNGDFLVIQKLVSLLPSGHQRKREVDFVLDNVFESSSMMHYHIREQIFVTYKQMVKAESKQYDSTVADKDDFGEKLTAILYLERYAYLIIFNAYLHLNSNGNPLRFTDWINQVGKELGLGEVLDNFSFREFGDYGNLRTRIERNCALTTNI